MIDFEIRKVKPEIMHNINANEKDKKRLKNIKSSLGRAAFVEIFGKDAHVEHIDSGIQKSENALKWIADTFK